jgi:hypothetical protein
MRHLGAGELVLGALCGARSGLATMAAERSTSADFVDQAGARGDETDGSGDSYS